MAKAASVASQPAKKKKLAKLTVKPPETKVEAEPVRKEDLLDASLAARPER